MTHCRNCGTPVPAGRVEAGYDYCIEPECVDACLEGPSVVAVHVNKAADQYVRRQDAGLQPVPPSAPWTGDGTYPRAVPPPPAPAVPLEALSDAGRVAKLERELDDELAKLDPDDHAGRIRLINAFNATLRGFNIRYRTLMRRVP